MLNFSPKIRLDMLINVILIKKHVVPNYTFARPLRIICRIKHLPLIMSSLYHTHFDDFKSLHHYLLAMMGFSKFRIFHLNPKRFELKIAVYFE